MMPRPVLIAGALLAVAALAGTGLMALTYRHAGPHIEAAEREALLRMLNEVVPAAMYDNVLLEDVREVVDPMLLGSAQPLRVYRARRHGAPVAAIFTVVAPDGYSGPIRLLVGVNDAGTILAVRVVSHSETPGLGDGIEASRSDWITGFDRRSLANPTRGRWKVKKDGGEFDQFTGATITPRAIVGAVHRCLEYFQAHRDEVFGMARRPPVALSNAP